MLEAMFNAEVGDDIFDEDPTVMELQEKVAQLLNKEAAFYEMSYLEKKRKDKKFGKFVKSVMKEKKYRKSKMKKKKRKIIRSIIIMKIYTF